MQSQQEVDGHTLAVRWCGRCRTRREIAPEWGWYAGLYVCGSCATDTDRRMYNLTSPDPILEPEVVNVPQHVRLAHVDRLTPVRELYRTFGARMDLRPRKPRPEKKWPEKKWRRPARGRIRRLRKKHGRATYASMLSRSRSPG